MANKPNIHNTPLTKDEEIEKLLKRLVLNLRYNISNQLAEKEEDEKSIEISLIISRINEYSEQNNRKYIKISENDRIVIWGHPNDPNNKSSQIRYILNDNGRYNIDPGPEASALIINNQNSKIETINIKKGYSQFEGSSELFEENFNNSKYRFNQYSQIKSNENAQMRFNKKFGHSKMEDDEVKRKNLVVSRVFFKKNGDIFGEDIKKIFSNDINIAFKAFRDIDKIAEANSSNSFFHTIHSIPYVDQENNWICGFDDSRYQNERHYSISGSKYSVGYKIPAKNQKKIEIIASDYTRDCYVLAMSNPGLANQTIELLELKNNPDDFIIHTKGGKAATIIDYGKDKNKNCPSLCKMIRTSGQSLEYGIDAFEKTNNLIDDIEYYMEGKFQPEICKNISMALQDALSIEQTNALIMVGTSKNLSQSQLENIIKNIITDFEIQNLTQKEISEIFINKINIWKSQKIENVNNGGKIYSLHKIDDHISVPINYECITKFKDNKCGDTWSSPGKVMLFKQRNKLNNSSSNNFIIETQDNPYEIRVRLDNSLVNSVNTIIKVSFNNENYEIKIADSAVSFRNIKEQNYSDANIGPIKSALDYTCEACISYENKKKIFERNSKNINNVINEMKR